MVLLAVLISTFNFNIAKKGKNSESHLVIQNIEVLSYAETVKQECIYVGSVDCPVSATKVKFVF